MNDTAVRIRIMVLFLLVILVPAVWIVPGHMRAETSNLLHVHFLDVGQGDAVFIQTPDGVEVLIDGGSDGSVLQELAKEMSITDRFIDMVVSTHPDQDHIGGLIDVLARYSVDTILTTEQTSESAVYAAYQTAVHTEDTAVVYARRGHVFMLGASTTLRVLYPESDPSDMERNASSIIVQLIYGETEVLLTGDAPKNIEEYLVLTEGEYLQSDVLKLGHHGSRTSTSELFLDVVDPQYAVVSAAENSRYGHPHVEVTDTLFNKRIPLISTAESGTITFVSNGIEIWEK